MEKGHNPTDLRGQAIEREEARQREQHALQAELDDMKGIMATQSGRRFIWRLLDKAGVYRTSFTGNSTTFFNEGQRNIGLMLVAQIHAACPDLYVVMLNEAKADDHKETQQ